MTEIGDDDHFKYAFMSFGASIRGFLFMRKVIMVDATFLHGAYRGVLMVATAQDADRQIYPLAFAVADSENDNSWAWFFQKLVVVFPSSTDLVFASDRYLSLAKEIEAMYNSAKHVICTRHMKQNIKTRFKKRGMCHLFLKAADSYTLAEFEGYYKTICTVNEEMGSYLCDADFKKWSRAHCPGDRYNIMTTNNAECINSILAEAKAYPIVALFDHIRGKLSAWFSECLVKAEKYKDLPPTVKDLLKGRCECSGRYEVKGLNATEFQVIGGGFFGVVDLERRACSCRVFDLDHLPCVHAIAVINRMKLKMSDFLSHYYKVESLLMAYHETIYPTPCKGEWVVPEDVSRRECHPPIVRKKSGRPRKKRIPLVGEVQKKIKKRINKCGVCGKSGHNKKTCANKQASSSGGTGS